MIDEKEILDESRLKNLETHGFQDAFLRSCAEGRLLSAGNQSGKTHIGACEVAHYALGEHPYRQIRTPNKGVIVSSQSFKEGIEKIIVPKLKSVVGSKDIAKIMNNTQGIPTTIYWRNGSITHLMSAEQDDDSFEGDTIDYFWIDEPVRRQIWVGLSRGLMKSGGRWWMTATLLEEPWITEEIYEPGLAGEDHDIDVFEGSTDDNTFLGEEEKRKFFKKLTRDEIQTRRYGKPASLRGKVFKSFHPDYNVVPSFDVPYHWPVWESTDPHKNKPHAVLYLTCSPQGDMYVCNEIFAVCPIITAGDQVGLNEHMDEISAQYKMVNRLIDTSAQEDDWSKNSAREMLAGKGIKTKLAQKKNKKKSGIILINQLLQNSHPANPEAEVHGDPDGQKLFIMKHCKRTIRELTNQRFKKDKKDKQNLLEEPEKKWDDMTDNLRYILVERPTYRGKTRIIDPGPLYSKEA